MTASMMYLIISLTLLLLVRISAESLDFKSNPERPKIQSPDIAEASGLASSPSHPDFLWIINDSGSKPDVHLVNTDGKSRGKFTLKDAKNIDWEDISTFMLDDKPYLLISDAGDNNAVRDYCTFYIVREPSLPATGKSLALTVLPTWQIQFRYEGGPRDCESAAVDAAAGKIIFLSKRTHPPEVYELPLSAPKKRGILTCVRTGVVEVKAPGMSLIPFRDQPTGLDISADGSLAAVLTYYGIFLFPRRAGENWSDAFARKPTNLGPHHLRQAESISISKDEKLIRAISEGLGSPIVEFQNISGD